MKLSLYLSAFKLYDELEALYQQELPQNFMRISALKIKDFDARHPGNSELMVALALHFKKRGEIG